MSSLLRTGRRHPFRGVPRLLCVLTVAPLLAACGPSPVDMVEYPVSTTPSRAAGQALERSIDPAESCAQEAAPAEFPGEGMRALGQLSVPRSPKRVLALGIGALDTACLLGVQDAVVGTGPLPNGTGIYLPEALTTLPQINLGDVDIQQVSDLRPDVILLPASSDSATLAAVLRKVAPTVVYDSDPRRWTHAVTEVADALGRPGFAERALLDFIKRTESTAVAKNPQDTRVSVVLVDGSDARIMPPESLGVTILDAVGAARPPSQLVEDGEAIPPKPESPAVGDEFSGDVLLAVMNTDEKTEKLARELFESTRWKELSPVKSQRLFVVDRALWEGDGLIAARGILSDIGETINSIAPGS